MWRNEGVPNATDPEYGFCLISELMLIEVKDRVFYTARYRVMLDFVDYKTPDPCQTPEWVLEGQDGYNIPVESVLRWIPISEIS